MTNTTACGVMITPAVTKLWNLPLTLWSKTTKVNFQRVTISISINQQLLRRNFVFHYKMRRSMNYWYWKAIPYLSFNSTRSSLLLSEHNTGMFTTESPTTAKTSKTATITPRKPPLCTFTVNSNDPSAVFISCHNQPTNCSKRLLHR